MNSSISGFDYLDTSLNVPVGGQTIPNNGRLLNHLLNRSAPQRNADSIISLLESLRKKGEPLLDRSLNNPNYYDRTIHDELNKILGLLIKVSSLPLGAQTISYIRDRLCPQTAKLLRKLSYQTEALSEQYRVKRMLQPLRENFGAVKKFIDDKLTTTTAAEKVALHRLRRLFSLPSLSDLDFMNFEDYFAVNNAEINFITRCQPKGSLRVAFGGSGPIDLSADVMILLAKLRGVAVHIHAIDICQESLNLSEEFTDFKIKLGILDPRDKTFTHADLLDLDFGRDYDALVLAAMIPENVREETISKQRELNPEDRVTALVIRSADGLVEEVVFGHSLQNSAASTVFSLKEFCMADHVAFNTNLEPYGRFASEKNKTLKLESPQPKINRLALPEHIAFSTWFFANE